MDFWMILKAFLVGGAICVIGQLLIDYTSMTPARILVLFVTMGVVLTAVGLYEPLVQFAGGVKEQGLLGALTGGITGAAGGIAASIFLGFLFALVAKSGDKS